MKPEQYEKISLFDVHPVEYALTKYWNECSKNPHVKYTFATPSKPMYLAGIYHKEDGNFHLVILAEKAGYPQSEIHNRQTVIFTYEDAKSGVLVTPPLLFYKTAFQTEVFFQNNLPGCVIPKCSYAFSVTTLPLVVRLTKPI